MARIAVFAVVSAGVAAFVNGSITDPASLAIVLAGIAGGEFLASRRKPTIGIDG
jgi:hypothetical protein